jgi:hypothetical protein
MCFLSLGKFRQLFEAPGLTAASCESIQLCMSILLYSTIFWNDMSPAAANVSNKPHKFRILCKACRQNKLFWTGAAED